MMPNDLRDRVRFRGKLIHELTREELEEALLSALARLAELDPPDVSLHLGRVSGRFDGFFGETKDPPKR